MHALAAVLLVAAAAVMPAGHSVEGRQIEASLRGDADAPVRVLVVGQIHGDESEGVKVVRALRKLSPPRGVAVWTVTSFNPDGARRGTRQNAHGVDLNRNFARGWRKTERGTRYWGGRRPFSQPESKAVRRLVKRLKPQLTIWFHQPYGFVNLSQGADPRLVRRYARLVDMAVRTLPNYPGTATAWQNHAYPGTDAFVVELRAGKLPARRARRHAEAVLRLAGGLSNG